MNSKNLLIKIERNDEMSNKHHFTESTALKHCDYDDENNTLEICFHSGGTHRYKDVPKTVYQALKESKSAGKFFHQAIRGKYSE